MDRITILMGNDDGIESIGLQMLANALSAFANVIIVAPDRERSSSSSALTLRQQLFLEKKEMDNPYIEAYSLTGTPADCMKFALGYLLINRKPDLIVSGINNGYNCGSDAIYSGTIAAALEGVFYHIPGMAISAENFDSIFLERAVEFACDLLKELLSIGQWSGVLNLNIPNIPVLSRDDIAVCTQGLLHYRNAIEEWVKEDGRVGYRIAGEAIMKGSPGDDIEALAHRKPAITLLQWSQNNDRGLIQIKDYFKK